MKLIKLGLLAGSILFTSLSYADMFEPSAYCTKPSKPYKFNNEWEVQQYLDSVNRYKRCISDFVEKQNRESQNHQETASKAIDEWNRFVKMELQ